MFTGVTMPSLWWKLKRNPVWWILEYIVASPKLMLLFAIWTLCIGLAIAVVKLQSTKANTATRKYFHAVVVVVFTSGILVDPNFLYLASIVSLCVMILLEHMRMQEIEPVASILKSAFKIFTDEKDAGDLVLTNIYLLSGVSLPLWLCPDISTTNPMILLSGVLCIGVGDSFASIVGSNLGRIKLFHTRKTLEGLLASVLSQLAFLKALYFDDISDVVIPIIMVSIMEAITTQVDNLVLPFFMYAILQLIRE